MKPKTMILMGVAIACGLIASYMTSQLLAEREKEPEPTKETVNMLVASKQLEMGAVIKDPKELFTVLTLEKGKEPANAYTEADYDSLKDRRLVNRLAKGQFVFPEDLQDKNKNSLAQRLPKGMRAVGIKVDITAIAGGFASLPMSRVDVISTIRRGDNDSVSQVILENVLVLAADTETQRSGDKTAMPASTVTVALAPEDAELVALAQEMGTLKLILRGDDEKQVSSRPHGVRGERLLKFLQARQAGGQPAAEEGTSTAGGGSLVNKVPDVKEPKKTEKPATVAKQEKPAPEPKAEVAPEGPKNWTHVLTIYNGDQGTRVPFKIDAEGNVVTEEITQVDPLATNPPPLPAKPKPVVKQPDQPTAPVEQPPARRGKRS